MRHFLSILSAVLLTALLTLSCAGQATKPGRRAGALVTPIADILDNPQHYADKIVTVKGIVTDPLGVGSTSFFTLTDRSGASIKVWCPKSMAPNEGERLKVNGEVHLVFRYRQYSYSYIKANPID